MQRSLGYIICEQVSRGEDTKIIGQNKVNGRVEIETVFQDLGTRNRNGRIYCIEDMAPQMKCERTTELIKSGNLFGEAGHPLSSDIKRQSTIDLNNIAHKITSLYIEGNLVKGTTMGTPNTQGQVFNDLILEGTIPAFSLRALGTINNTPKGAQVKNIKLITYDHVIYPSHKAAYMQKILGPAQCEHKHFTESSSVVCENGLLLEQKDLVVPITNDEVIDYVKQESSNLKLLQESLEFLYEDIKLVDGGKKVMMYDYTGHSLVVNLESYISNEIMDYCWKEFR